MIGIERLILMYYNLMLMGILIVSFGIGILISKYFDGRRLRNE